MTPPCCSRCGFWLPRCACPRESRVPDAAQFAELVEEGQQLRRRFDRESAGMRVLTAEDRARVSR